MTTPYIAPGFHTATPYLVISGAARALDFYHQAFGAMELVRVPDPAGKILHAEIQIGDSRIMLADECPEMGALSPGTIGGTPISLMLYVEDCDQVFNRAIAAGAKVERAVQDQFYGDRSGNLVDPFGHKWTIATHKEDVPPEEMERRMAALFGPK